ncbi:hypothetical protein A3H16_01505 [Candidatus Kaiserbacteria bacterium RIFCSPLOWO2_12_FULL_53_8]|uniref:BrnT family toxin n=2 Tax=Candidatus Kaiseribacteriota TaxID=1752734 RepID=A0A1F6CW48_9BACT|nr:MAG: hypothetical protein A2851_00210 [Candidatus Kaiserbacteria bacterium RIFCSPHIGHO2_01_FULL_53_29]OGG91085.1 MAG: hypothetical protein A3H16_01505 [Candidatus Kaiserbacteria bacterium RIFCSPLOWO2_12_FULL_53_8]
MRIFADVVGFEWDDGNKDKNLKKHGVTNEGCEQSFSDERRIVREDTKHSRHEARHWLIGKTPQNRLLFVSFTIRKSRIRVISARNASRKERTYYEEEN